MSQAYSSEYFRIINKKTGKCLDATSTENGRHIQQWWPWGDIHSAPQQFWKRDSSGCLINKKSRKYLEIPCGRKGNLEEVGQYQEDTGDHCKWDLLEGHCIINRKSGKYLEISNGNASDGFVPTQWESDTGDHSRWKFDAKAIIPLSSMPVMQQDLPEGKREWACGVHSATRLLKSYGHSVNIYQMLNEIGSLRIAGYEVGIGKPQDQIVAVLKKYEHSAVHKNFVSFGHLLKLVGEGKPVATLLFKGRIFAPEINEAIPALHWVVVAGVDLRNEETLYFDTDSNRVNRQGIDDFKEEWAWKGWNEMTCNSPNVYSCMKNLIYGAVDLKLGRNAIFYFDKPLNGTISGSSSFGFLSKSSLDSSEFNISDTGVKNCRLETAAKRGIDECKARLDVDEANLFFDWNHLQQTFRNSYWKEGFLGTGGRACSYSASVRCYSLK